MQDAASRDGGVVSGQDDVLSNLGEALGRCSTAVDLYRTLYEQTSWLVDSTGFLLGLYDDSVQTVTVVFQVDSGVELPGGSFPLGGGFTSQVIRTHQPRLIRRWSAEGPRVRIQYATDQQGLPESGITVPLLLGPRVVGVLSVQSYRAEAYDATDLLKMQVIAGQAAVAIDQLQSSTPHAEELPKRVSELEAIVSSMSDALLIVDSGGSITRLNHAARKLLCPEDSASCIVLGQPLDKEQWGQWAVGPRAVAEALSPLVAALRRGETVDDLEVEVVGLGRQVFSFSCSPLYDVAGVLSGGVIVFHDVTGRREVERVKDEVLSIASHDLKGPVAAIKGQAQYLHQRVATGAASPDSLQKSLAAIVKSSDHLVELLDLLLDLSRIEAGRFELHRSPTDLVALAQAAVERAQALLTNHRLVLNAPARVEGQWDARRLAQLFQNLLSNAVKYSPKGGTVEVNIAVDEEKVTVQVRDEGVGIRPEELPRLFDRFFRAEGVQKLEGAGLGLYICQGIVAAHGGRLWAESEGPERGSTFSFTLPR